MNLNRMAGDIGVDGLGDRVSESAGGPRCCMAATTGDLLTTGRNGRHIYVIALAVRIQYFGFTSDLSTLHSLLASLGWHHSAPAGRAEDNDP